MDPAIAAQHLLAGKYFQIAAFVMFVYDHMLTLGQEVERIWTRRFSYATMLYLVNRYATLMQFIIIVTAFNDPDWKGEVCSRFVLFEGASTVAIIAVGQMIMILRVVAIYEQSKRIFAFLSLLWAFQIIISAVGVGTGYPVPLAPGFVGCILTGSSTVFASIWISPLVTDSCIFLLTVYRTKQYIRHLLTPFMSESVTKAIMTLLRDGTVYFFLIFLANFMNALIYFLATPDLKATGASFSQLLTCTMISRLVLNLRSLSDDNGCTTIEDSIVFNAHCYHPNSLGNRTGRQFQSTSIWSKALNDFAQDGSAFSSESVHGIADNVPLQRSGSDVWGK